MNVSPFAKIAFQVIFSSEKALSHQNEKHSLFLGINLVATLRSRLYFYVKELNPCKFSWNYLVIHWVFISLVTTLGDNEAQKSAPPPESE